MASYGTFPAVKEPPAAASAYDKKVEAILAPYNLGQVELAGDPGVEFSLSYEGSAQTTFLSHAWFSFRERVGDEGLTSRWKSLPNGDLYEVVSSDNGSSVTVQTPSDQETYLANELTYPGGPQVFSLPQLLKLTQRIADQTDAIRPTRQPT